MSNCQGRRHEVVEDLIGKIVTLVEGEDFSIGRNAVHGSDAGKTAEWEIDYFFKK